MQILNNGALKRLFVILTLLFAFALNAEVVDKYEGLKPISLSQAERSIGQKDIYFVDINTPKVRNELGNIKGALLVNINNFENILPKDKNATLIFYCLNRICSASKDAALLAYEMGYKNVYYMPDGVEGWVISGRATEKKRLVEWNNPTEIKDFKDNVHDKMYFGALPSCRDCHGTQKLDKKGIDLKNANNWNEINKNCASCHKETAQEFTKSVHAQPRQNGMSALSWREQPKCATCHNVHEKKTPKFTGLAHIDNKKQLSDKQCGSCHKEEQKHYYETFHGKAMYLNVSGTAPTVAACYDCHGKHNILKPNNIDSTLSPQNRMKTCLECHPNTNKNFTEFIAHADHSDGEKYPVLHIAYIFMTSLVIGVFGFFGLHTFLWSIRLLWMRLAHPKEWKIARERAHHDKVAIRRFSTLHRIQHFFMASSFLGLSFTGLPQKFYTADWAQTLINFLGGPIMATKIHHFCAFVMCMVFVSHLIEIGVNAYKNRAKVYDEEGKFSGKKFLAALFGPDSLMPRGQDIKDMVAHIKWFFNLGPRPQFDRWTYWEKFDYLAVFWGMVVIGLSGFMLWFPTFFSYFLPGWTLNLATLVHSDEALLATGFIFAIHFFNTHFRADRFPMDMVIFSGTITAEEMRQERSKWYERLEKEGKLRNLVEENGRFKPYEWIARTIGFMMLFTGLIFLFMIIYAFVASCF